MQLLNTKLYSVSLTQKIGTQIDLHFIIYN